MNHSDYMREAIKEAELGLDEGGVPIGSVLVLEGKIIGRGRNQRVQKHSVILHAEMDAIENAGQRTPEEYQRSIMYTTLSACQMCSGTIVYLGIRTVVMAENENAKGAEEFLKEHNVELINLNLSKMKEMLRSNR